MNKKTTSSKTIANRKKMAEEKNPNSKLKQQIKELKKEILKNKIQAVADYIKGLI